MTKFNVKKSVSKMISKVGTKTATGDLNQACVYFIYQPKKPKSLMKSK